MTDAIALLKNSGKSSLSSLSSARAMRGGQSRPAAESDGQSRPVASNGQEWPTARARAATAVR